MTENESSEMVPCPEDQEKLPEELREIAEEVGEEKVRRIIAYAERYSGPLPHPKHFADYGKVLPDAPERILRMAEKEQEMAESDQQFNHDIQLRMVIGNEGRLNWGLGLGVFVFIAIFGGALFLIIKGYNTVGYVTLATLGIGVIVNFITGKGNQSTSKDQ